MSFFLDTSALVKIYHAEPGYESMGRIYDGSASIGIAILTQLEFRSAMARRLRTGSLNEAAYQVALEQFSIDLADRYEVFSFSDGIVDDASRFIEEAGRRTSLRSLDALQFAFYRAHCDLDTLFVSSDARFVETVAAYGYPTLDPTADGSSHDR